MEVSGQRTLEAMVTRGHIIFCVVSGAAFWVAALAGGWWLLNANLPFVVTFFLDLACLALLGAGVQMFGALRPGPASNEQGS